MNPVALWHAFLFVSPSPSKVCVIGVVSGHVWHAYPLVLHPKCPWRLSGWRTQLEEHIEKCVLFFFVFGSFPWLPTCSSALSRLVPELTLLGKVGVGEITIQRYKPKPSPLRFTPWELELRDHLFSFPSFVWGKVEVPSKEEPAWIIN